MLSISCEIVTPRRRAMFSNAFQKASSRLILVLRPPKVTERLMMLDFMAILPPLQTA
jgi:hypothetical protein